MAKQLVIFGGSGLVGSRFIELNKNNFQIISPSANEVDILDKDQVQKSLEKSDCDVVINFAAFTDVEGAENQKDDLDGICYRVNVLGPKNIAEVCKSLNKHLIQISTDYVFDGTKETAPYTEEDKPNPVNWYGKTKYLGEQSITDCSCPVTIVRICMPFSAFYELKKDIARFFLGQLKNGLEINAITDQRVTPTYVDDIAHALGILSERKPGGIYHVCSKSNTTTFGFAEMIAEAFELNKSLVKKISLEDFSKGKKAKLLKNSWLDSTKFRKEFGEEILHTIEEGVNLFKQNIK